MREVKNMRHENPLFSVVMPTYNRANIIGKAIESILEQTFQSFEIIVIDNGSTDDTQSVLEKYRDDRIRYFWQEGSGCPASPRNAGIGKSKGDWICFLDSDDSWYKEKLECCFELLETKVDLLHHDLKIIGDRKSFTRKTIRSRQLKSPITINLLVNSNVITTSSVVVRRSLVEKVGGFDESSDMGGAEDLNLWLKISEITNNFIYIPKILGEKLLDEGNFSRKDMSFCYQTATTNFLKYLNINQQRKYAALFSYMHGRFKYTERDFTSPPKDLIISLKYGGIELKLKSAWMLLACQFRK